MFDIDNFVKNLSDEDLNDLSSAAFPRDSLSVAIDKESKRRKIIQEDSIVKIHTVITFGYRREQLEQHTRIRKEDADKDPLLVLRRALEAQMTFIKEQMYKDQNKIENLVRSKM